ncbi:thioesterase family protein [Mycolicibacterium sp.]|uniref:thioesterase family protein n=1 Tax=Mycolicibacterium sp. TaxID=2320850 RepID=UPI003D0EAA3D
MPSAASLSGIVGEEDTAAGFGPSFPRAASTPFVLGLAEVACHNAIAAELAPGEITVGTAATIEHRSPSPVGATLTAHARLTERAGRRLRFEVDVFDGEEVCATVTHSRAVVLSDQIAARLAQRVSGDRP